MSTPAHDLHAAWRALRATPGSTLAAVLILALGTGANTAVLAITYGILLRPLPYADVSQLVLASMVTSDGTETSFQRDRVDAFVRNLAVVDGAAGYADRELTVRGAGEPRVLRVTEITEHFFDVLGSRVSVGIAAASADAGSTVVLSDRFAREMAAGEPGRAIGRTLQIGDRVRTVAAVMPDAFGFPAHEIDMWAYAGPPPPTPAPGAVVPPRAVEWPRYRVLMRLKPGVTLDQLRADVVRVVGDTQGPTFGQPGSAGPLLRRIEDAASGGTRPALLVAVAASVLVLLVACANVAVLLLGLQTRRTRELAVRLTLGASGWRLVRATFVECLLLAAIGSVLGVWIATVAVRVFIAVAAGLLPRLHDVALDLPVLAAATAISAIVAVVCGMAPAITVLRRDVLQAFRGHASSAPAAHRLRSGLIAAQIALSFVLVAGTGLLARSVLRLADVDAGVDLSGTTTARLVLSDDTLTDPVTRAPMLNALAERIRALPGVQHAGVGSNLPPTVAPMRIFVSIRSDTRNDFSAVSLASASPGYLDAIGARLVRGRLFEDGDSERGEPVVIVSESAARFLSPDKDIVGSELIIRLPRIVGFPKNPRAIGVIRDVKYAGLDAPAALAIYVPWRNLPIGTSYLAVRTTQPIAGLASTIRAAIRDVDPALPTPQIRSMDEVASASMANRRLRLVPAAGFAFVALALSLVGLTATLSRAVHERRRELAIRSAVGASPTRLTGMVLSDGLRVTLAGLAAGIALTLATTGSIAHLLYGVSPYDLATFGAVALLIALGALCASLVPASRAAKAQPVELLRAE